MTLLFRIKAQMRLLVGPLVGSLIAIYFAFHVVKGDRGLVALVQLENKVVAARQIKAQFADIRQKHEKRVRLLHPNTLDADMLDERARVMLNYGQPDEIIVTFRRPSTPLSEN
jgi:cell division protein FtsB